MAEKLKTCTGCGRPVDFNSTCKCVIESRKLNQKERKKYKDNDKEITTRKWRNTRLRIIKRDGGICIRCFEKFGLVNMDNLTVHHIKSRKNYPELMYDETNLITICQTCNNQLGTDDKLDFEYKNYNCKDEMEVY